MLLLQILIHTSISGATLHAKRPQNKELRAGKIDLHMNDKVQLLCGMYKDQIGRIAKIEDAAIVVELDNGTRTMPDISSVIRVNELNEIDESWKPLQIWYTCK